MKWIEDMWKYIWENFVIKESKIEECETKYEKVKKSNEVYDDEYQQIRKDARDYILKRSFRNKGGNRL